MKIKAIYEQVRGSLPCEVTCVRTKHAVTMHSQYPYRSVQIVLRLYHSPAEILAGFDVDAPCVAYDGSRLIASPRAVIALMRQANTVDMSRRSPSYELRLAKYASRGFEILIPDLRRTHIDKTIFQRELYQTNGLARLLVLEALADPDFRPQCAMQPRPLASLTGCAALRWIRRRHNVSSLAREDSAALENSAYDVMPLNIPYVPGWNAMRTAGLIHQTVSIRSKSLEAHSEL